MELSNMGILHTVIGIVALVSGFMVLWKNKQISYQPFVGKVYLVSTVITAASALTIFKHGNFNVAHGLAILTLLAVLVGLITEKTVFLKSWNKYFMALCYSSTVLFHLIPTATEILTRFPTEAPLVTSIKDPLLHQTFLGIFIIFLMMLTLQMNWLRKQK